MTSTSELRIVVHGARGRMGTRIIECARDESRLRVVAALDVGEAEGWIRSTDTADVVIDFSSDAGAQIAVRAALAKRSALLVGTTALSERTMRAIEEASRTVPVLVASNTSLGIAVARHLATVAASMLGAGYDIDIVERHHRHKVDAPSGTAKSLAEALQAGGASVAPTRIHALRAGDVVGEHTVSFCGPGEILEIRHAATSRDLFARGALTLAAWLVHQPAGLRRVEEWVAGRAAAAKRGLA